MDQVVSDVQLHSSLIDDYLYIQDAPASSGPPGSFVAARNGEQGRSDLLTIDSSGNLQHFAPDSTSPSGWRVTHVNVPAPAGVAAGVFRTVSFYSADALHAICLFPAPQSFPVTPGAYSTTWMVRSMAGSWSPAALTDAAKSILSLCAQLDHYEDASGNDYVYGVVPPILGQLSSSPGYLSPQTAIFFVLYYDANNAVWDVAYQTELGTLNAKAPATFHILSGGSGNPMVLWIDPDNMQWQQAALSPSQTGFSWVGNTSTLALNSIAIDGVSQIIPFPGTSSVNIAFILDNAHTLWMAQFQTNTSFPILIQLTGIEGAPAGANSAGLTVIGGEGADAPLFLVEAGTSKLWLSRRYAGDLPLKWVNLGNHVQSIAVPETVFGGLELFYVDLKDRVFHLSQNPGDTVWVSNKIAAPVPASGTPAKVSSIAMHAAAVDGNGAPVANALFTVTSDQWINLVVQELSYWTGPSASATFPADGAGHATVQFLASSLAMPKLTFSAVASSSSTEPPAERWCQADVIEVKPNETGIPVSASSMASRLAGKDPLYPINEQMLENAGLLDPNFKGKADAVNNITQIGQWMMAQNAPSAPGAALQTRHWRFEFAAGNKSCRELAQPLPVHPPGGFFSDIFGDVTNWAKHAAGELTSIAISVGTTFEIAFNDAVSFTVATVREAGEALEVVFVHIVQGIEDVITVIKDIIAFLMLLFEWKDILHTHNVLNKIVTSFMTALAASAGDLQTLLSQQFAGLSAKITSVLGAIGNNPSFTQSFNQYANAQTSGAAAATNVLANPAGTNAFHHHLPQCLYVYSHAKGVSLSTVPSSIDISGVINAVQTAWNPTQIKPLQQQFLNYVSASHGGYGSLLDFGIAEIVQALEDLLKVVLAGAEAVSSAILELISAMVSAFHTMFKAGIKIPVISFIYKTLTGNDLKLLDLFCLLFAVPVTILYKALNNGNAPFGPGDAGSLVLPWPQLNALARKPPSAQNAPADLSIYQKLGVAGVTMDLINAFIAPACDGLAFEETPSGWLPTLLTWTSNVAGFITAGLQAPWSLWIAHRMSNSADIMTTVLWCFETFPSLYDSLFALTTGGLGRFFSNFGPIIEGGYGIALLGLGIATGVIQAVEGSSEGYTGWDTANSMVPLLARPFRFLILDNDNPTTPISMGALISIDIVISGASAFTQLTATMEG